MTETSPNGNFRPSLEFPASTARPVLSLSSAPMAKHPTSSRVHRDENGPDDAFVSTIKRSYTWGRENSRILIAVLAILLLAGIAAFWYYSQQRQLEAQAAARLTQVQQSVASGNAQLAIRDLQTYLDRFGGTRTADQARLVLASILIEQDRAQDALDALGNLPNDLQRPFGLPAARLQAAANEEAGNIDQAISTYLRISERARFSFERTEALADAARLHLQNGEPDAAARLYDRLVEMLPRDDPEHGYYQVWLAEAQAQARQGRAAPRATPDTSPTAPASEPQDGSTG